LQSPKEQRNQTDWKSLVALAARPCHASARCSRLGHGRQYAWGPTSVPEARSCPPARWAATSDGTVGHTSKTRHRKRPSETAGRDGASIAKFRTRRPAPICETSRYRAVFERPSYVTRWRRTGWLGRRDSSFRIPESEFAQTLSPGGRTRTCASRIAVRGQQLKKESQTLTGGPAPRLHGEVQQSDFEMQRFESRRLRLRVDATRTAMSYPR
jgi:hypothetical protein